MPSSSSEASLDFDIPQSHFSNLGVNCLKTKNVRIETHLLIIRPTSAFDGSGKKALVCLRAAVFGPTGGTIDNASYQT